ncbi:hypothetical protein DSO57_1016515 [Entomophthora muscae]|uniref:Uncharacterized protein n=1 Tax=Entomophthora muscae TaxID=34485 RepID=A0ACC2UQW5_9FUNG|nr:hypothetical protein DSO57_1016515 [Entomophthora muscae]
MNSNLFEETLDQINQLKIEAQLLVRAQKEANSVNRGIRDLKAEYEKLLKCRDDLVSILDEENQYLDSSKCLLPRQIKPEQIQPLIAYQENLRKAEAPLFAHRFTGKSVFKVPGKDGLTGYRIETFSEGYLKSKQTLNWCIGSFGNTYYLFFGADSAGNPKLIQHTIPPEIDIGNLVMKFLSKSVEVSKCVSPPQFA